jgi:hypothetical protein
MYGSNNLPVTDNVTIYNALGDNFQIWNKPVNASFIQFTVVGGGGGGGAGSNESGSAITSGSGGGGGAPGGLVSIGMPAILVPDTLYIRVGTGGAGGASVSGSAPTAGNNGGSGSISYISLSPGTGSGEVLIQSSNSQAGGGGGGTFNVAGAAGTAITLADTTNLKWMGINNATVAQTAAGAGGLGSNSNAFGASVTYAGLLTGGGGGGNMRSVTIGGGGGGSITLTSLASAFTIAVNGGAGGFVGNVPSSGANGFFKLAPFISTGGAGGGGGNRTDIPGQPGGDGAYGCGGGGGGAGRIASGAGGRGGDGLVIITVS